MNIVLCLGAQTSLKDQFIQKLSCDFSYSTPAAGIGQYVLSQNITFVDIKSESRLMAPSVKRYCRIADVICLFYRQGDYNSFEDMKAILLAYKSFMHTRQILTFCLENSTDTAIAIPYDKPVMHVRMSKWNDVFTAKETILNALGLGERLTATEEKECCSMCVIL
jgi:hypothetical protein